MLGAGAGLGLAERARTARQRREAQAEAGRAQAAAAGDRAAAERQARLARELAQLRGPAARPGILLAALARSAPAAVTLREVITEGDDFTIRGGAAPGSAADLLPRFRRDFCPPAAAWRIADSPGGPADFTWRGSFTPAAGGAADLAAQLAAARAALRPAATFDAWMREWSGPWILLARSEEHGPALEVRRLALAYAQPRLRAWSDIVRTLLRIEAEPGLTIDRLILAAAPDQADAFAQAQISLTARLRPGG